MLFEESSTDMAMSQGVPLYDVYKDGFAPVRAQYEFHGHSRTARCSAARSTRATPASPPPATRWSGR